MSDKSNEIVISDAVKAIAEIVKKNLTLGEGGVVEAPKDLFKQLLPDEVTIADFQKVQKAREDIINGVTLAVGETGLAAFKKDKKLQNVSLSLPFGKDKYECNVAREKTFRNPADGTESTKYGVVNVSYKTQGAGNGGEFKRIKELTAQRAAKMLG